MSIENRCFKAPQAEESAMSMIGSNSRVIVRIRIYRIQELAGLWGQGLLSE